MWTRNLISAGKVAQKSLHHRIHGSFNSRCLSSSPFSLIAKNSSQQHSSPPQRALTRSFSAGGFSYPETYERRTAMNWGIRIVPEMEAYVVERFGKFQTVLESGLHLLIPFVDQIAYIHTLKERVIHIPNQAAVTSDNVSLHIDGVLFIKVVDAEKASYGVDDPIFAVTQLAQTTMRSAIGKMILDKTFMERDTLNSIIVEAINDAASNWGLLCLRYEIRDITPPQGIKQTMEMQAEAERRKRAEILEAEGKRQAVILASEAAKINEINRARGTAVALRSVSEALEKPGGKKAASLKLVGHYLQAFENVAKESTTILLPSSGSDLTSMLATGMSMYKKLVLSQPENDLPESHGEDYIDNTRPVPPLELEPKKPVFSLQSPKKSREIDF